MTVRPTPLARLAVRSLYQELALYPKPGLVSLVDRGAHHDMDAGTFVRSLFALRHHFAAMAVAGAAGVPFATLQRLGLAAEADMLRATGGVNTHRGAIFSIGLIAAAAAHLASNDTMPDDTALRGTLRRLWGAALDRFEAPYPGAHGEMVRRRHGCGGARAEARAAFPAVFEVALPALRHARARGASPARARLAALFALLGSVQDTNVLYRAGARGLAMMHHEAHRFAAAGGVLAPDALGRAESIHRRFVTEGISPGGCADLLAAALFVDGVQASAPRVHITRRAVAMPEPA